MNASDFSGAVASRRCTGISLWDGGTEQMFFGTSRQTQNFGFNTRSTLGVAGIKTVDFSPSINTAHLIHSRA